MEKPLRGLVPYLICGVFLLPPIADVRAQFDSTYEVDRTRLIAMNAVLTGTFAAAQGLVEGRFANAEDVGRAFLWGAAGGYGFYQAKRMVGNGQSLRGLGLAYLSTSVVENVSGGRHPLAAVRFGIGPLDLRVRTPLAKNDTTALSFELNAVSTLNLILLPFICCRPAFEDAVFLYRRHGEFRGRSSQGWQGQALNRTIMLDARAGEEIFNHELVHLIQSLQFSAVTPYYRLSRAFPAVDRSLGHRAVSWDIQIDWLYLAINTAFLTVPYEKRWAEREAYTLD